MKGSSARPKRIVDQTIWFGIGFGALFWILESVLHVFVFHEGDLLSEIFNPNSYEIRMRLLVTGLFIIFSVYAQLIINQRKRAEGALRESEEFSSSLLANSPNPILVINPDSSIRYMNPALEKITGFSSAEIVGREAPYPWWTEETLEKTSRDLEEAMVKGTQRLEEVFQKKNGEQLWVEITSTSVRSNGRLKYYLANWVDVTERKLAEETLRQSEEKYRGVLEASPDPIVVYDMQGRVIYLNPSFTLVFSWTQEELWGKKIHYIPEENWPETQMMIDMVLKGKSFSGIMSRRHTKQGNILDVSISVATYVDRDGLPLGSVHILRDITEQKHIEAQLQQAQKMESIGTLAGGIAHDFNNLLMAIQGNVSLMLMDMDSTHPYYERFKSIEKQVQSGAKLTSHLLGYARKGRYEVKPIDLNHLLEETSETFGRTRKQVTIQRELAEDLFAIEGDVEQIEQVLWNLLANAADAMPRSGYLILKTINVTHQDMKGKCYDPKPGNYVLLTVTDTGIGMDKETLEHVFEPFFTTKEMGRGTGLGLASAYGIIKGHGGYIDVHSKKGRGATFSIYLPASEKRVQRTVKTAEEVIKVAGTVTVLLVDDEEVILKVGQELLEAMACRVLTARDGKEAIEVYRKNRDEIDFVVLDMVMPNMGGGKAYDRLKEINPDIKVLLSSGYSIDGEATEILERGCDSFIQKPFNMKKLSRAIREVLGRDATETGP